MKWVWIIVGLLLALGGTSKRSPKHTIPEDHPAILEAPKPVPVDTLTSNLTGKDGPKTAVMSPAIAAQDTVTRFWEDESKRIWVRLKHDARLWGSLAMDSKDSVVLQPETVIEIVGSTGGLFKAQVEGKVGFLAQIHVPKNPTSDAIIERGKVLEKQQEQANAAAKLKREAQRQAARKKALIEKYGEKIGADIYATKIWIGMTKEMAQESWGEPVDINTTVTPLVHHEQWVYEIGESKRAYLYFEDGILTSYQY